MDKTAPDRTSTIQDRSLLVLILDVTPTTWSKRYRSRIVNDKLRLKAKKGTVGPATLTLDVLPSLLTFLLSYAACNRENALVVIACAGNDVAVVYPRKGAAMERMVVGEVSSEGGGGKIQPQELEDGLRLGVMELMNRCTGIDKTVGADASALFTKKSVETAAITAATSQALAIINRFLRASSGGSSTSMDGDETRSLLRRSNQEQGILAMIANRSTSKSSSSSMSSNNLLQNTSTAAEAARRHQQRAALGLLSPRILIVQSSPDRTSDYNAFMNCVFAASNLFVTIDGCFIPPVSAGSHEDTSPFLEQACDRTGGVFTRPKNRSQVTGGLAEIFLTVFLPPIGVRADLNLLKVNKVDFKAMCFETGEKVEIGVVCSLCLSVFKKEPAGGVCKTCGASVHVVAEDDDGDNDDEGDDRAKKAKLTS